MGRHRQALEWHRKVGLGTRVCEDVHGISLMSQPPFALYIRRGWPARLAKKHYLACIHLIRNKVSKSVQSKDTDHPDGSIHQPLLVLTVILQEHYGE